MKKYLLFAFLIFAGAHTQAQTLLAQYNFDNDALDAVGNHHGTPTNGPTYTTDRFGNPNSAIFLDGIDDYVVLANALTLQVGTYTYDFWVNPSSNPGAAQAKCVMSIGGNGGDQLMTNAGNQGWNLSGYQNPAGTYNTSSGITPVLGQWYHVTGTRDMTTGTLYVNGVQVDVATFGAGTSPKYGQINAYIGRRTNNGAVGPQFFHGAIDDLKIYSGVNIPLPLDLISFTGEKENNNAILKWETVNMKNVLGFEIEKSNDAISFEKIGYTEATEKTEYVFTDHQFSDRNNFYRLKMLDADGRFSYSRIISVINNDDFFSSVYPNPVLNELTIFCNDRNFQFQIYDIYSRLLLNGVSNEYKKIISAQCLPNGIYILKTEANGKMNISQFSKQ